MDLPDPVAVGYFPKVGEKRPADWRGPKHVDEICSVSHCICPGPEGWIDSWRHNELGLFPTEDDALALVGDPAKRSSVFAYKVYPLAYDRGLARPWKVPLSVELGLDGFELLGFDAVSRSQGSHAECSPLSCNLAANEFRVNRHCLLDGPSYAHEVCLKISAGDYEPGPYYLFEVHRRRRRAV